MSPQKGWRKTPAFGGWSQGKAFPFVKLHLVFRIRNDNKGVDLAIELQNIYNSEINVQIGWFWDCGIGVRLGDEMNGFLAEETVASVADIVPWLQEAIAHFYPTFKLCGIADAGNPAARPTTPVYSAESRRAGNMPALRRT